VHNRGLLLKFFDNLPGTPFSDIDNLCVPPKGAEIIPGGYLKKEIAGQRWDLLLGSSFALIIFSSSPNSFQFFFLKIA
jgi:hypothetical protein